MVAKISTGKSLYGAITYNNSKVEMDKGEVLFTNRILKNSDGEMDMTTIKESFELHLLSNLQTEKPIVHISLNPHPDDKLTDEQLKDIAQEYMEKMGYANQPYVVYKHEDIERAHIHIVTTNVDINGKKINSDNNFHKSKKATRELEKKYGLHTAEKKSRKEQQAFSFKPVDASKDDVKMQISNIIKPMAALYKFQSFGEYRTLLSQYNICVEQTKGEKNGNAYEGLIYYATDDKGKKISSPLKSSLFGKSVGHKAIHEKCAKHKTTIKQKRLGSETATKIANATKGINNKKRYVEALKKENIDVVFRDNEQGRIYGVTFIDHNNCCVFNGSRLGKEFSANVINDALNNAEPQMKTQAEGRSFNDNESSSLGGLFDLPIDGGGIDDPEEELFRNRMQRKKKRKARGHRPF